MNPKNRMFLKYIILGPIFLMIAWGSHGQTILNGKYSSLAAGQEHYEFYDFRNDTTFRFNSGASLGNDLYGMGKYHIVGDTLELAYITSPHLQPYHTSEIYINDNDSIQIEFQVFNLKKEEISGVNVIWKEGKNDYKGVILDETRSDFLLEKKADTLQVVLSNLGYQNYQIILDRKYNYEIKVFLQEQNSGLPIRN